MGRRFGHVWVIVFHNNGAFEKPQMSIGILEKGFFFWLSNSIRFCLWHKYNNIGALSCDQSISKFP